jgi:hypothetical protein
MKEKGNKREVVKKEGQKIQEKTEEIVVAAFLKIVTKIM